MFPDWVLAKSTIEALKGQTMAGDNIHYNLAAPLTERNAAGEEIGITKPHLVITTFDMSAKIDMREWANAPMQIDMAITAVMPPTSFAFNDFVMEMQNGTERAFAFNLLFNQIKDVLNKSQDPWPQWWRKFIYKIDDISSVDDLIELGKTQSNIGKEGNRLSAVRALHMTLHTIAMPTQGETPYPIWDEFSALLSAGQPDHYVQYWLDSFKGEAILDNARAFDVRHGMQNGVGGNVLT